MLGVVGVVAIVVTGLGVLSLAGSVVSGTGDPSASPSSKPQHDSAAITKQREAHAAIVVRQRYLRVRADSLLRVTPISSVSGLSQADLELMRKWGRSSTNPETFAALDGELRVRKGRDRAKRDSATTKVRLGVLERGAANYRFDDGSACTAATPDTMASLLRNHPQWSDRGIVGVACRAVWIGMTDEELVAVRGRPEKINTTVTAGGRHEQWVYGGLSFLAYVDNGVVTAWQNLH
jgi:hypothetical protein